MHDTAFRIGGLVLHKYCTLADADILEIGAFNVNGTLRDHVLPTTRYTGLDFDAGPGVDVVAVSGQPYPIPDEAFDLVMASSVLEHDSMFWMTFLDMCRKVRSGGHIYINAPTNGAIHRYPEDNWRFYPDSGRSLARWAQSQGQDIVLVESFTADRQADHWNDFCAVFRKGPSDQPLPDDLVHEQVACANIFTWKSDVMANARAETQDMLLIDDSERKRRELAVEKGQVSFALAAEQDRSAEALMKIGAINQQLEQARGELEQERTRAATLDERKAALEAEVGTLRQSLAEWEAKVDGLSSEHAALDQRHATTLSTLRQREEEIAQTRDELSRLQGSVKAQEALLAEKVREIATVGEALDRAESRLKSADAWVFKLAAERQAAQAEAAMLQREAKALRNQLDRAVSKADRFADERDAARDANALLTRDVNATASELDSVNQKLQQVEQRLERQLKEKADLEQKQSVALAAAMEQVKEASRQRQAVEIRIAEQTKETAAMTNMLLDAERVRDQLTEILEWLVKVNKAQVMPFWWHLMPPAWRVARLHRRLRRRGLFDAQGYLALYPDVDAAKIDPVHHFIHHGMYEGRQLVR